MNFKGVSWHKLHRAYQATCMRRGVYRHLGYHKTPTKAIEAFKVKVDLENPDWKRKPNSESKVRKLSTAPPVSSSTTNERCDQMSRIEERYSTAINSGRSLRLSPSTQGSADVLIAAGLSKYEFGLTLMRLRSEWDSGHDQMSRMNRLASLPAVREHFSQWSLKKRIPTDSCIQALIWWLDHVCPVCEGRGFNVIPDTPMLSDTPCSVCHGSGSTYLPDVEGIDRALDHIQRSVDVARRSMSYRLRSTGSH